MTTLSYAVTDSTTMLRRSLKRMVRYPSMTLLLVGMPIVFLMIFVFVFGGALGAGLGGTAHDRTAYLDYLVPGIILLTLGSAANGTSISIAMDMTEGIIARFRTMAIARVSVLTGHVIGSVIQAMLGVGIVFGVSFALGFRTEAGPLHWLAAVGLLAFVAFAITWLSVAFGLVSDSVETASNLPMFLTLLPFLGSGFVPTASMPAVLRWFADYQPFTPIIETLRGLLMGTPVGNEWIIALAWGAGTALFGYVWAKRLYNRKIA